MPIDQLPRTVTETMPTPQTEPRFEPQPAPAGPRQTLAMRLAARNGQRELRAARLARLRTGPDAAPADPARPNPGFGPGAPQPDTTFLEVYLRGLPVTAGAQAEAHSAAHSEAHSNPYPSAGSVLPFLGTTLEAATDLGRLPGAGPGLVQALRRAGLHRLSDVARLDPAGLAARLGPIGRLIPAAAWIAAARAGEQAAGAAALPPRPEAAGTAR